MNLLNNQDLKWKHYKDDKNFDFPIDYSDAVLDAREDGRLEILVKWAPNSFCHFHRHTAETSSVLSLKALPIGDGFCFLLFKSLLKAFFFAISKRVLN